MQYAPGIQDQSANIIMAGNAMSQRSGEQMANIAGYFMGRAQKAKAMRSMIEAYGPTDEEGDPLYDKQMLAGMNADELEGIGKGLVMKSQQQELQSKIAEQQARAGEYQAMGQERLQRAAEGEAVGKAVNAYFSTPNVQTPLPPAGADMSDPASYDLTAPRQDFDATAPVPGGRVVERAPTHFERMQNALVTSGIGGRTLPAVMKSLTGLQDLVEDEPGAQWDTYDVPGATAVMVSKRGTKQSFLVPKPGAAPVTGGEESRPLFWTGKAWQAYQAQGGAGTGQASYADLNRALTLRNQVEQSMDKLTMTPEGKAVHQKTLDDLDQHILNIQRNIQTQQGGGGKATGGIKPTETPAVAAPSARPAATGTGLTKGNAIAPGPDHPELYKTPEEVRADSKLTKAQKLAILRAHFNFQ